MDSYRRRRWRFARQAARTRLGSNWTVGGRIAIAVIGGAATYFAAVGLGEPPASAIAGIAAIIGAVVANVLWALGVLTWSYLAAPAEMDREVTQDYEDQLAKLGPASAPADAIRTINSHLDNRRAIVTRLKRMSRDAPAEEWTPALKEAVDWVYGVGELVNAHCVGKRDEFVDLRRSIPTAMRAAGRDADGSPWVSGRSARWREWIGGGAGLLRACIERIESRPHA